MVDSATGSRSGDSDGNALLLSDSHTAAATFGLTGAQFLNVPKTKFLYYVKFHLARSQTAGSTQGLADWESGLGMVVKNVDRPRVSFETETLNQYNRKRVVQTTHKYEPIMFRFHDTVSDVVNRMFLAYYQFYYSDSKLETGGTSIYDVVTPEGKDIGKWGFQPPADSSNYGYFFSHITVYQMFSGQYNKFELINPKIRDFNPDELDSSSNSSSEIQMSFDYENIIYSPTATLDDALKTEMGLTSGKYWNVETPGYTGATYGIVNGDPSGDLLDAAGNVLKQNLASLVTGQGTQSVTGIISSVAGQFDANRGLAVGKTAVKSLKNLVNGDVSSAKQGAQGLLKGVIFGSPGKFF